MVTRNGITVFTAMVEVVLWVVAVRSSKERITAVA
jgi:hypothetical protein